MLADRTLTTERGMKVAQGEGYVRMGGVASALESEV